MKTNTEQLLENKIRKIYKKILTEASVVPSINKLTQQNDHTGAIAVLAKMVNQPKYVKIMEYVEEIHMLERSLTPELRAYRDSVYNKLLTIAKSKFDDVQYQKIKNSF